MTLEDVTARLGHARFRPGIVEAATAAVEGDDVLAVMPSGYGKSTIYQIAGSVREGLCVIVSPLIALQKDQVAKLDEAGIGRSGALNSSQTELERQAVEEAIVGGHLRFVLLAPEQLANNQTVELLRDAAVTLFVVDEAHCISAWGHDFRPDYQRLGQAAIALGRPPIVALTATAAPPVRSEIVDRLSMQDPKVFVHGFDRPNLVLEVQRFVESADKDAAVLNHATAFGSGGASGIIYVSTRQRTEALAAELKQRKIPAAAYHAGLPRHRRSTIHEQFMDGSCGVIVATSAFGMGIDKPDVRFVLHADIAESLDAHYQEIGRAGRDGVKADTILFYRPEDLSIHQFFGGASLPEGEIRKVAGVLADTNAPRNIDALATTLEMSRRRISNIVNKLEAVGALKVTRGGALRVAPEALINAAERAIRLEEDRNRWQASRIEMMRDYAETTDCRRRVLLTYFGEAVSGPCARCDNCHTGRSHAHDEDRTGEYQPGTPVRHREWGRGRVLRNKGDQLVVLFETVGYKALSLSLLKKGNLLQDDNRQTMIPHSPTPPKTVVNHRSVP